MQQLEEALTSFLKRLQKASVGAKWLARSGWRGLLGGSAKCNWPERSPPRSPKRLRAISENRQSRIWGEGSANPIHNSIHHSIHNPIRNS